MLFLDVAGFTALSSALTARRPSPPSTNACAFTGVLTGADAYVNKFRATG